MGKFKIQKAKVKIMVSSRSFDELRTRTITYSSSESAK